MSTGATVAVEQGTMREPCCCTVAQAVRNGHCEEVKQMIACGKCKFDVFTFMFT